MTAETFRRLALDLEGVEEHAHMGHPDFRVNGRIFSTLRADDTLGMVKVTPEEQAALLREHPDVFEPSPGAWGRQGCTDVRLAAADRSVARAALLLSWEGAVAKPAPRGRGPGARERGARTRGRGRG